MSLRSPCAKKHLLVLRFRVFPPSGSSQQQWPAFDFCHLERGWNSNAAEQEPTTQFFQLYSWSILYIYIYVYIYMLFRLGVIVPKIHSEVTKFLMLMAVVN